MSLPILSLTTSLNALAIAFNFKAKEKAQKAYFRKKLLKQ